MHDGDASDIEQRQRIEENRRALSRRREPLTDHSFRPVEGAVRREVGPRPGSGIDDGERGADEYHDVVEVVLVLRPANAIPSRHEEGDLAAEGGESRPLGRAEIAARFGADPADVALVEEFARDHGLTVLASEPERRRLRLSAPAHEIEDVFGVEFEWFEHEHHPTHRGFRRDPGLPAEIKEVVTAVLGLSDRPQAGPHLPRGGPTTGPDVPSLTATELAEHYRFPSGADGTGATVAVLVLGGGYYRKDIEAQATSLGLPIPDITDVSVGGKTNEPCWESTLDTFVEWANEGGSLSSLTMMGALWTVEVTQDVELIASLAPGARILVFFAPNTDLGITDALTEILHHDDEPSVLTISWGQPEPNETPSFTKVVNDDLWLMGRAGVTVCCAAGDGGSSDGLDRPAVDFPASSPNVLACGGTSLRWRDGVISDEVVWNDAFHGIARATGGGASELFGPPSWQHGCEVPASGVGTPGRGLPDVAAVADPNTGCTLQMGSGSIRSAGTSAAAPTWAALIARVNGARDEPVGFANSAVYAAARRVNVTNDITSGNNDLGGASGDVYPARSGWDPCTGLGTPIGESLFDELVTRSPTATRTTG